MSVSDLTDDKADISFAENLHVNLVTVRGWAEFRDSDQFSIKISGSGLLHDDSDQALERRGY